MKLIFCDKCWDVFKLDYNERTCKCGKCSGRYINNSEAVVNGEGYSFAIGNGSLVDAIRKLIINSESKNRNDYIYDNKVICWVRPHEGSGNPHTKIERKLKENNND